MTVQAPIITESAPIPTYFIGSDMVILLGETALVSSKSAPGQWREVDATLGICLCPGYQMRGHCRHIDAVKEAQEQDRVTAEPVERPVCPVCGIRPVHFILGNPARTCARCAIQLVD